LRDAGLPAFSNALKQIDFLQIATRPAGFEEVDLSGEAFLSVDIICIYVRSADPVFLFFNPVARAQKQDLRCSALPFLFSAFEDRLPVFPLRADLLSQKCSTSRRQAVLSFCRTVFFCEFSGGVKVFPQWVRISV